MGVGTDLKGPRLEFVVRKIPGSVARQIASFDDIENKIVPIDKTQPAGFMVFLPNGHSYRMSQKELDKRGFNRTPNILGFAEANDTNTAAGRFKLAATDAERKKAYGEMEAEVVKASMNRAGTMANMITGYDPTPVKEEKAA
jgi:hypothetical protein